MHNLLLIYGQICHGSTCHEKCDHSKDDALQQHHVIASVLFLKILKFNLFFTSKSVLRCSLLCVFARWGDDLYIYIWAVGAKAGELLGSFSLIMWLHHSSTLMRSDVSLETVRQRCKQGVLLPPTDSLYLCLLHSSSKSNWFCRLSYNI